MSFRSCSIAYGKEVRNIHCNVPPKPDLAEKRKAHLTCYSFHQANQQASQQGIQQAIQPIIQQTIQQAVKQALKPAIQPTIHQAVQPILLQSIQQAIKLIRNTKFVWQTHDDEEYYYMRKYVNEFSTRPSGNDEL